MSEQKESSIDMLTRKTLKIAEKPVKGVSVSTAGTFPVPSIASSKRANSSVVESTMLILLPNDVPKVVIEIIADFLFSGGVSNPAKDLDLNPEALKHFTIKEDPKNDHVAIGWDDCFETSKYGSIDLFEVMKGQPQVFAFKVDRSSPSIFLGIEFARNSYVGHAGAGYEYEHTRACIQTFLSKGALWAGRKMDKFFKHGPLQQNDKILAIIERYTKTDNRIHPTTKERIVVTQHFFRNHQGKIQYDGSYFITEDYDYTFFQNILKKEIWDSPMYYHLSCLYKGDQIILIPAEDFFDGGEEIIFQNVAKATKPRT